MLGDMYLTLTSKQRATLRGTANGLDALFQVGKGGVEPQLVKSVSDCLEKRELVKLRLLETAPESAQEAAAQLAKECRAQVVQVIGRVVVLFRQKPKDSAFSDLLKK